MLVLSDWTQSRSVNTSLSGVSHQTVRKTNSLSDGCFNDYVGNEMVTESQNVFFSIFRVCIKQLKNKFSICVAAGSLAYMNCCIISYT